MKITTTNQLTSSVVAITSNTSAIPPTYRPRAITFNYLSPKACVKVCVRELGKRNPTFADALKKKTYAKLGRDHPDLRAVRPCPVPLVVVCNKYDVFKVNTTTHTAWCVFYMLNPSVWAISAVHGFSVNAGTWLAGVRS